jgi:hypothetical protein
MPILRCSGRQCVPFCDDYVFIMRLGHFLDLVSIRSGLVYSLKYSLPCMANQCGAFPLGVAIDDATGNVQTGGTMPLRGGDWAT